MWTATVCSSRSADGFVASLTQRIADLQTCRDTLRAFKIASMNGNIDVQLRLDDLVRMRQLRELHIDGVASINVQSWLVAPTADAVNQLPSLTSLEFDTPEFFLESPSALTE